MNNISRQLKDFVLFLQENEVSIKQIAQWAYQFSLDYKVYNENPSLDDVLEELSCMDADDDSFVISKDEIIKMLKSFIPEND